MSKQQEALRLALEALETYYGYMEPLLTVFGGPRVPAEQSTTWKVKQAIAAIKEALAQQALDRKAENARELGLDYEPEQEPVAWLWELTGEVTTDPDRADGMWKPLYTSPPAQRTWVGLTDEEIDKIPCELYAPDQGGMTMEEGLQVYARAIEAKLKEKNT